MHRRTFELAVGPPDCGVLVGKSVENLRLVCGTVSEIEIGVAVFAVVETAFEFVHMLRQGAAQGDVQLLKATAAAQHRRACFDSRLEEEQRKNGVL